MQHIGMLGYHSIFWHDEESYAKDPDEGEYQWIIGSGDIRVFPPSVFPPPLLATILGFGGGFVGKAVFTPPPPLLATI